MSAASTVSTMPPPAGAVAHLPDFSERLSPMLVKELRQGMRSPLFVWGLIAMNLFLAGVVWLTMDDPQENTLHQAFFGGYCALVCGLLPLRAAGALHDELRGNTIDTLVLTKLTGWRITLGKWIAVTAQQVLATVTVLPYLIVRYFAGGINVPMELAWLGIFLLAGMGSAAVLTGFSWLKYFLFRAAIMMGMTFLSGAFCVVILEEMFDYHREYFLDELYENGGWPIFLVLAAPALHLAFFALDLGASKVGAIVENRSLRRRLTGLGFLLFYGLMAAFWNPPVSSHKMDEMAVVLPLGFAFVTFLVIGLQAILELPLNLPAVVMPMVKRGWAGRLAGRFFYPGWPSGVCYLWLILLIAGGGAAFAIWKLTSNAPGWGFYINRDQKWAESVAFFGATFGMMIVPLVIWRTFFRNRLPWNLGVYGLLMMGVVAIMAGIAILASSTDQNALKLGLLIPAMGVAWVAQSESRPRYGMNETDGEYLNWDFDVISILNGTVTVLWWLAALLLALVAFRLTREVEQAAAGQLGQDKAKDQADG